MDPKFVALVETLAAKSRTTVRQSATEIRELTARH